MKIPPNTHYPVTIAQEELAERNRRPTKLCVEYHLHQRGSKSQTFVLPGLAPRPRTKPNPVEGRNGLQKGVATDCQVTEVAALPPANALVELALTPFKDHSRSDATGGEGVHGGGDRRSQTPPVVKLNLSLLGFKSVGPAAPVAAPPGQRTLREVMRPGRIASFAAESENRRDCSLNGASGTCVDGVQGQEAVEPVAQSPVASVPMSPTSSISPVKSQGVVPTREQRGEEMDDRQQVAEDGVLVRCPRCKACLPLGKAWDEHRGEHEKTRTDCKPGLGRHDNVLPMALPSGAQASSPASRHVMLGPPQLPPLPPSGSTFGAVREERNDLQLNTRQSGQAVRGAPSLCATGVEGRADDARDRRSRLSDLLQLAVTPEQAAGVLRDRGLLRTDGQTRFAHLGLDVEQQRTALEE